MEKVSKGIYVQSFDVVVGLEKTVQAKIFSKEIKVVELDAPKGRRAKSDCATGTCTVEV